MPSFKERFRPSRKIKKNKDISGNNSLDEPTANSGNSMLTITTSADEQASSFALSAHHSVEYCK